MQITLYPKEIFTKFLGSVFVLLIANILSIILLKYIQLPSGEVPVFTGDRLILGLLRMFDVNEEANVPSFFSSIILIINALLLFLIGFREKTETRGFREWYLLSIIFLFLAIDENASIHELLIDPVRSLLNTSGIFYFAWVIPYGIAVLFLLYFFYRFLVSLPRSTGKLFWISGSIYILGAIGFELAGGFVADNYGFGGWLWPFLYTCEEFLEMLGMIIFCYALTSHRVVSISID